MLSALKIEGRRGALLYDPSIDRPVVQFARGGFSEGLHCGQLITLVRDKEVYKTRLELDEDGWYYADTHGLRCEWEDLVYLP